MGNIAGLRIFYSKMHEKYNVEKVVHLYLVSRNCTKQEHIYRAYTPFLLKKYGTGWAGGWMDGWQSPVKDCLQQ